MGWLDKLFGDMSSVDPDADESVAEEARKGYKLFGSDPEELDKDVKESGGWAKFWQDTKEEPPEDKKGGFSWF